MLFQPHRKIANPTNEKNIKSGINPGVSRWCRNVYGGGAQMGMHPVCILAIYIEILLLRTVQINS